MGNANLETLRRLGAKYWQVIVTSVTTVLTGVTVFYDFNDKSPGLKTALAVTVGLFIVIAIRFPRVAIKLTKIIFGPTPLPPNPPQIFRGPRPYVRGETLPGRQAEVERCLLSLQQTPFLLLEGESGCGKSSLLNAALLPAAHASFRVVECRVAEDPFGKMILALGRRPDPAGAGADGTQALLEAIKSAPDGAAAGGDAGKPLLICIDQFEELFVTVRDAVRNPFVAAMRDAIVGGHARFILGMRSDFTDLLLRICRTVDPEQQALDAGSYYSLKAFSGRTAKSVLDTMLEPLHNGDPLRKQQLEDFSDSLVQELLRPPRDKRLCQDDEKTVLPVELQTVGMMIESVGVENFSTEGYRRLGRKAGLLRAYIDEAKTYVWRKTGVSGDQALLVLRQLISPARTKWAQTPTSVGEALGLPPPQAKSVLDAFAERFLVNKLPDEAAGGTSKDGGMALKYELMHEHLVRVLVEAPQPILQQARDAEERLQFWRERTEDMFSTRGEGLRRLLPPQPIPLTETLRLRRFAASDDLKRMLRRNLVGFGVRLVIGVMLPLALAGVGWLFWTRSDRYQMREIVRSAPVGPVAAAESSFANDISLAVEWSKALTYGGWADAAFDSLRAIKDSDLRANGFTAAAASLAKTGNEGAALAALKESFTGDGLSWVDERERLLSEVAEVFGRANKSEELFTVIRGASADDVRVGAFWASSQGLIKAGKADDASRAFNEAVASASYMKDIEGRADKLLSLAEKSQKAGRAGEAVKALNEASMALRSLYPMRRFGNQLKAAGLYAELNDINQTAAMLNEAFNIEVSGFGVDFRNSLTAAVERMAAAGRAREVLDLLARGTIKGIKEQVRGPVVRGLAAAGKTDEALSLVGDDLQPIDALLALAGASDVLMKKGDTAGARRVMDKFFNLPPAQLASLRSESGRAEDPINSLIDEAIKLGEIDKTVLLSQTLEQSWGLTTSPGWRPSPLTQAAMSLVEAVQIDRGLRVADGVRSDGWKTIIYLKATTSLLKAGQLDRATEVFGASLELINKVGLLDETIRYFTFMETEPFEEVAVLYARAGRIDQARLVIPAIQSDSERLSLSGRVIWELVKASKEDTAKELVQGDEVARSKLAADLAMSLAKAGKGDKALALLSSIKYNDDQSRARAAVAQWQARQGLFYEARQTAQSCSDSDKLDAYTIILTEYAKRQRPEFASQFLINEPPESN